MLKIDSKPRFHSNYLKEPVPKVITLGSRMTVNASIKHSYKGFLTDAVDITFGLNVAKENACDGLGGQRGNVWGFFNADFGLAI